MLCDNCKKREANIHVSRMMNGVKYEQNLCMECAGISPEMFSMFSGLESMFPGINDMLSGGAETMFVGVPSGRSSQKREGLEEKDFEEMGLKLPTAEAEKPVIRKKDTEETLEELNKKLSAAVDNENYEKAAEIRDKIYVAEKKMKGEM